MLLGGHQSISKSIELSIKRALADGCECLQVFVKNNNRWEGKKISEEEAERFKAELKASGLKVCAHSCYLINLASVKEETYAKSINSCHDELTRCDRLNIPYFVIHPGSHLGNGEEAGIKRIADSLDRIYESGYECVTLLEMVAGQGTNIGYSIENMLDIIEASNCSEKIGICLDSCHIFAAGYNIKSEYEEFFRKVVNDSRFSDILGILETPAETTYEEEIKLLKSYRER